jgi:hypothetical protein
MRPDVPPLVCPVLAVVLTALADGCLREQLAELSWKSPEMGLTLGRWSTQTIR